MIIYLHGFDSNSPGNHEKVLQLQFIDPDVRLISYSTRHPKHDMQHLLKEVDKMLQLNVDERPLICGVGLGGYWAERIGFLCDIRQVVFNPNLFPNENMEGKIDRPEEYVDIATIYSASKPSKRWAKPQPATRNPARVCDRVSFCPELSTFKPSKLDAYQFWYDQCA